MGPISTGVMACLQPPGSRGPAMGRRCWPSGSISKTVETAPVDCSSIALHMSFRTSERGAPLAIISSVCFSANNRASARLRWIISSTSIVCACPSASCRPSIIDSACFSFSRWSLNVERTRSSSPCWSLSLERASSSSPCWSLSSDSTRSRSPILVNSALTSRSDSLSPRNSSGGTW